MRKAKQDVLKKLAKYSKEEIIEALCETFFLDLDRVLNNLEHNRRTKVLEEHRKTIEAQSAAGVAYIEWLKEMTAKYGDGEKIDLRKLTKQEIQRGARLEKAWDEARKAEKKLDNRVNKLLGL